MPILGSADFVGHVTMIEKKKFMITDHFLISIDLIDFRPNLLFFVTRSIHNGDRDYTNVRGCMKCVWGAWNSYNTHTPVVTISIHNSRHL